jgi:hypothetical protein
MDRFNRLQAISRCISDCFLLQRSPGFAIFIIAMSGDETQPSQNPAPDEDGRGDCFAPPAEPCECYCLHCQRVFMSDGIWFQKVINARDGFKGFWMCPTPNCDGAGFTFDIFPTDPAHPGNAGWSDDDGEWVEDDDEDDDEDEGNKEYDPSEPHYAQLGEIHGDDDDDDLEGEEWKHGLQPGERPPEEPWVAEARKRWEDEQARYDGPDERPRVQDWSNRPEQPPSTGGDDIPF